MESTSSVGTSYVPRVVMVEARGIALYDSVGSGGEASAAAEGRGEDGVRCFERLWREERVRVGARARG